VCAFACGCGCACGAGVRCVRLRVDVGVRVRVSGVLGCCSGQTKEGPLLDEAGASSPALLHPPTTLESQAKSLPPLHGSGCASRDPGTRARRHKRRGPRGAGQARGHQPLPGHHRYVCVYVCVHVCCVCACVRVWCVCACVWCVCARGGGRGRREGDCERRPAWPCHHPQVNLLATWRCL